MSGRKKWHELEEIGQRIREARESLGMTQEELAEIIGSDFKILSPATRLGNRALYRITELTCSSRELFESR